MQGPCKAAARAGLGGHPPARLNRPMDERSDHPAHRGDGRAQWPEGPMGRAPSTEERGDPEAEDVGSGATRGAAAGAVGGALVAGPVGLVVGSAAGALVGAGAEALDDDERRLGGWDPSDPIHIPGSTGTGPTDPLWNLPPEPVGDPHAPGSWKPRR